MSRPIYIPIADSFFESSIMREDLAVRFVMLALIRLALRSGANGEVDIDPVMFALSINLPLETVEGALHKLMQPDPASSSPDEDGRRIVPVDPARPFRNWRLVNWEKYRHIVHLANDAARKREQRHPHKDSMDVSENVQKRPRQSRNVQSRPETALRNTKNEERNTKNEEREEHRRFAPPSVNQIRDYAEEMGFRNFDIEGFHSFYESKGWVVGKSPMRSWKAAMVSWRRRDEEFGRDSLAGPKSNVRFNPEEDRKRADWEACEAIQAEMEHRKPRPYEP